MNLITQVTEQGWQVLKIKGEYFVRTPYEDTLGLFKLKHPAIVHLEIYKDHPDSETRFQHLKKARQLFWPDRDWHYWTERRYRAFCEGYNYVSLSSGASTAKSWDVGEYAILFWAAAPQERNVTVASVTLSSLLTRVWGYLTNHIRSMAVEIPYSYTKGNSPKILYKDATVTRRAEINEDTLHGIFAVTAKIGDDDQAVATWIGKHPKDKILLILDECTDMPMSILNALPNLDSHPEKFQLIGVGNAKSTSDLHGILSTPANGWNSVSPELIEWRTTQRNGICLYFSPYESPAIHEQDPEKKARLSKYLITQDILDLKEKELGKDSEKFARWVLGFWQSRNTESVTMTEGFVKDFLPKARAEWTGFFKPIRVAGLDPAFSTGGDKCILRFADVGHTFDNKMRIDFKRAEMLFEIRLSARADKSVELQIADQAIDLMLSHGVLLDHLAIDVTGQGRAIGEVIRLRNEQRGFPLGMGHPLKIYAMSSHNKAKRGKSVPDILPVSTFDLWELIREFIEHDQICGLDDRTLYQLTNRKVLEHEKTRKKVLETKREYKIRMSGIGKSHSPDEADGAALCLQVIWNRLNIAPGATQLPPENPVGANRPLITGAPDDKILNHVASMVVTMEIPEANFTDDSV